MLKSNIVVGAMVLAFGAASGSSNAEQPGSR
jgi:hypothetical protein